MERNKIFKIRSLNCRGLKMELKCRQLATDMDDYKMDILCIQETHLRENDIFVIISFNNKRYCLQFRTESTKTKFRGVGIVVEQNLDCTFNPVHERLCYISCKINNRKCHILTAYAPALPQSEKNSNERLDFYDELNWILSTFNKYDIVITGGDFKAKTRFGFDQYRKNLGRFAKGMLNNNGKRLLELM